jgi:hypothetical protein
MKKHGPGFFLKAITLLGIALLALSACGGGGSGEGGAAPDTTHKIQGAVTGVKVSGVKTILSGDSTATTTTNDVGYYSFSGLKNGTYSVKPSLLGYTFSPSSKKITVNGADLYSLNFTASSGISGPYLYAPDAKFHEGKPPAAVGNSTALVVKSATTSAPITTNSTITWAWTVTWPITTEIVTYVDVYIPEIDGYFEYPVDAGDAAAGGVHFDMVESDTAPPSGTCSRCAGVVNINDCWCATEAPTGTTEDARVELIGTGGDVGQPVGGVGITWGQTLCTSFTYSSWSACSNNTQSRTVTSSSPGGCTGGIPGALSQSCTPQTCTYTYSNWSACANNTQTRTVTSSSPDGCTGTPVLSQSCTSPQTCTYTYSSWSACSNNTQSRTVTSSSPSGCTGSPVLSQSCTSGSTPGAGYYVGTCTVNMNPITCGTVTVPGSSFTSPFNQTVSSGTSLSQFTSDVCAEVRPALSAAGCASSSCSVTASTSNSASFSLSCSIPPVSGCSTATVTEVCTLSK